MTKHLPSLRAIQTFEAAARHLSFTQAADELHVTPGAISRQIRALEDLFGQPLFERIHRGVNLTSFGIKYFNGISHHFSELRKLTEATIPQETSASLHILCSQTFAIRWLMPRLPDFHRRYPQFDVTLTTSSKPLDFATCNADVAIRLGQGDWKDTISYPLVTMPLMPVCSPSYRRSADFRPCKISSARRSSTRLPDRTTGTVGLRLSGLKDKSGARWDLRTPLLPIRLRSKD
ncbi:LysR family transcriptional regulator, glycine cleavage system transcriptional activator [Ensifer sp. YR511]|nr:LysR family transcriptional regulator, glycine cleavage system transcriptional activator [Ensifer sp. YR511]